MKHSGDIVECIRSSVADLEDLRHPRPMGEDIHAALKRLPRQLRSAGRQLQRIRAAARKGDAAKILEILDEPITFWTNDNSLDT